MCWCNPNLRTPCCGGVGCHPSVEYKLHQDYKNKLKQTLDMLEYSHVTSEVYYDYERVSKFIGDVYKFIEENEE